MFQNLEAHFFHLAACVLVSNTQGTWVALWPCFTRFRYKTQVRIIPCGYLSILDANVMALLKTRAKFESCYLLPNSSLQDCLQPLLVLTSGILNTKNTTILGNNTTMRKHCKSAIAWTTVTCIVLKRPLLVLGCHF